MTVEVDNRNGWQAFAIEAPEPGTFIVAIDQREQKPFPIMLEWTADGMTHVERLGLTHWIVDKVTTDRNSPVAIAVRAAYPKPPYPRRKSLRERFFA